MALKEQAGEDEIQMSDSNRFPISSPSIPVPPESCDCHTHVFGPVGRFPFFNSRKYTPQDALPSDLDWVMKQLKLERCVIVQPSPYGTDNQCLLHALGKTTLEARGIAVVEPGISGGQLRLMHSAGVRGIRLNGPHWSPEELKTTIESASSTLEFSADSGWHMELFASRTHHPVLRNLIDQYPIPLVLDHWGGALEENETPEARFQSLRPLLDSGRCWIKLSAPYRVAYAEADEITLGALAAILMDQYPSRLIWGSDWPHTPPHPPAASAHDPLPFRGLNTGCLLDQMAEWLKDGDKIQKVLVDNPQILYQF